MGFENVKLKNPSAIWIDITPPEFGFLGSCLASIRFAPTTSKRKSITAFNASDVMPHKSQEISQRVVESWVDRYLDDNYYHWTIALKDNGEEPVGDIAVVNMNESISMMHIGYCIGKAWWHRGITSEALKAVMDFLLPLCFQYITFTSSLPAAALLPCPPAMLSH